MSRSDIDIDAFRKKVHKPALADLIKQIREEMPFLPEKWSQVDVIRYALSFMLANPDDVEEWLEDEAEEDS